jgi:hypothetical protein
MIEKMRMDSVTPRYSKQEFAKRGDVIYATEILPKIAAKDVGRFLAIDIETGEYEIAADEMKAGDKLRARFPESQIWMVRIGYPAARSFGGPKIVCDVRAATVRERERQNRSLTVAARTYR